MKLLYFLCAVCIVGILIQSYADYNLNVSYKYEVDLAATNAEINSSLPQEAKDNQYYKIQNRKEEIVRQRKTTRVLFYAFITGLVATLIVIFIKKANSGK